MVCRGGDAARWAVSGEDLGGCRYTCKNACDTSLSDVQWAVIEPLLPVADPRHGGRPLVYDRRLVIDTLL